GDERDYAFAKHFAGQNGMPEIINIFNQDISEAAYTEKTGFELQNSDFLNGLDYKAATEKVLTELETIGAGKAKVNYRLRDAVFSRQRYWGEPFPVYYVNGLPKMIDPKHLPIVLPEVEKYLPTEDGQPPLGNAKVWAWDTKTNKVVSSDLVIPNESEGSQTVFPLELNTMPGWAGSSWYWLRYMDAQNDEAFASAEAIQYWENVDLYIGGSEHATGHLLYSRFWNKFLKDRGYIAAEEPFKKLINQGMILGNSAFGYRFTLNLNFHDLKIVEALKAVDQERPTFMIPKSVYDSHNKGEEPELLKNITEKYLNYLKSYGLNPVVGSSTLAPFHIEVEYVNPFTSELDIEKFKKGSRYSGLRVGEIYTEDSGKYIVGHEVEKMSKSKFNVVNPDDIANEYGADTLRLYEMFLGPLEQAKP